MRHLFIGAAFLLAFTSAQETYYVTPMASTPCPQEGVPCFTLSEYITKPSYYFAFNSTLILLPGIHSLDSEFWFEYAGSLTISKSTPITTHSRSDTSIICSPTGKFTLYNIGVVSMRGLVLLGCMDNLITSMELFILEDCSLQSQGHNGTGLALSWVISAKIVRSSFSSSFTGGEMWHPVWNETVRGGGAIMIWNSSVTISDSKFNNNTASDLGGAVFVVSSNITIYTTTFNNNTVTRLYDGSGGALHSEVSNITIYRSTFSNNTVDGNGGAVRAILLSDITIHTTTFNENTANGPASGGAVNVDLYSKITMHNSLFNNNIANGHGGAVYVDSSNITTHSCIFKNNTVTKGQGGAVYAYAGNITIHSTIFNNNSAIGHDGVGGGMFAGRSVYDITIYNTTFNNNSVTANFGQGGALFTMMSNIITIQNTKFNDNSVTGDNGAGGAVYVTDIFVTVINTSMFNYNTVIGDNGNGGAVYALSGTSLRTASIYNTILTNNAATHYGGAVYISTISLNSTGFLNVQNNVAAKGGALYAAQSTVDFSGNTTISNNYGSLYAYASNLTFAGNLDIMNNSYSTNTSQEGGAVTAFLSEVVFTGTVTANICYNIAATYGGAIAATQSKLHVYGDITITHNTAYLSGGGIYCYQSELNLDEHTTISYNSAVDRGGGIYSISSITRMKDHSKTYFVGNRATKGGGICLEMNSKLYTVKKEIEYIIPDTIGPGWVRLEFTENSADYGGALYITDETNSGTCYATPVIGESTISTECFIQGLTMVQLYNTINIRNTYFINNTASNAGDAIYGGLLDRCTVNPLAEIFYQSDDDLIPLFTLPITVTAVSYILNITDLNTQDFNDSYEMVSSDPVRLCFCRDNQPDCSYNYQPVNVKKGETFTVSLVAVDQANNTISNSTIFSYLSAEAGLGEGQSIQITGKDCTELRYTVTSSNTTEQLHLYADGPCKDIGISLQKVDIYFTTCPIGFKDTGSICDCDPELTQYISNCSIDDKSVLRRENVWIAFMNVSGNKSVVTYPNCPFDYCYSPTKEIRINVDTPDDADKQCAFNRSGKLCGSCKDGLSLSLGSSRCIICSYNWLALLIVFAIAGIALVAFLLLCNFTVAAGTVNGLLFYANIVSSNKAIFFSNSTNRFFTIFIAWLNLDFGFETCFFNGLNGYWKTWLQLAFPAYVIFLVVVIIKACEYSSKFTRFMRFVARKNPVATLDTLVLLSYMKCIRTIISAWQFATLEYSDGRRETVWLVDGNVRYFELKHIILFVAALVILVIALIYTLLLFLWQWLLLCPNRQPVRWIRNSRLHGIMDAYFITFNKNHRYWTGLLLLARVLLYLLSAVNGSDPRRNLVAIISVVGSLILWKELTRGRIYRKWPLNILDSSFLFNLATFTVVTWYVREAGGNQTGATNTSVSTAFITFILIIFYHVYAFAIPDQVEKIKVKFMVRKGRSQQVQNIGTGAKHTNKDDDVTVSVVDRPEIPLDGFDTDEEDDLTNDTNSSTMTKSEVETQPQIELEDFASDNTSKFDDNGPLNISNCQQEDKDEEDEAMDYDELAPLLPLYNTA